MTSDGEEGRSHRFQTGILMMSYKGWIACAFLASSGASASSPTAWAAFNAKVARTCNAASNLPNAHSGEIVMFDDSLAKVVTLVTGKASHTRGQSKVVKKLCIYDQRSDRTWTSEVRGWNSPDRQ